MLSTLLATPKVMSVCAVDESLKAPTSVVGLTRLWVTLKLATLPVPKDVA